MSINWAVKDDTIDFSSIGVGCHLVSESKSIWCTDANWKWYWNNTIEEEDAPLLSSDAFLHLYSTSVQLRRLCTDDTTVISTVLMETYLFIGTQPFFFVGCCSKDRSIYFTTSHLSGGSKLLSTGLWGGGYRTAINPFSKLPLDSFKVRQSLEPWGMFSSSELSWIWKRLEETN